MKKFMENVKKYWIISLVLIVLLVGAGGAVLLTTVGSTWFSKDGEGKIYSVYVQSDKGQSLEKVYVMLCAEDGTEITWLPYVTNGTGKIQFSEGVEEGCYLKVVGVPIGYKLDESVKYKFDSMGNAKITLEEDDSVYIAKIGDTKFMSFSSALGVANASSNDVVIELLADVTMNTGTVKNGYGKNITVKGNGHTITVEGGNNTFLVNQDKGGIIAFENLKIKHNNTGAVFQVNALATLNLTDVEIDATKGSAYNYALINTLAVGGTTTLNMTRVDVKMAVSTPAKANQAGIIRTGNTSGTKTVNINMVDCNLDAEGATGRQCIVVMKNTVANIKATNCTFKAGDNPAIWAEEQTKAQTLTMINSKAVSTVSPHTKTPIKGYAAMIGNTYHLTFGHAAEIAAKSKSNVTIKAVADVTMKTCTINNKYGKVITVDGNGKTITTSGGSNAFILGNNVAFKNMKINHKNTGSVFQITEVANLKVTDVTINATEGKTYNYTLVNTLAEGDTTTVDFTRVNVKMAVESKGSDKYASIIRTGNDTEKKTVVINLTDCNFDTTKATGRSGIAIVPNTKATVNLKNTTIKTMDMFAIRSNEQDINWKNADTKLTSLDKTYQDYPVEYYLAKIGDVFYTLKQAADVANAATKDTEIKLMANYTISSRTFNNKNGKQVTLNGNGKTLTTSGGSNALLVGNKVAIKDLTINHKNTGSAIQVVDIGTIDVTDVTINATEGKNYDYALVNLILDAEGAKDKAAAGEVTTLNMTGVNVTMAVSGRGIDNTAVVRTGNATKKTVNINLTKCNFDTTKATGRSGLIIMSNTNATVVLTDTNIKTLDAHAVQLKDSSNHQTMTVNGGKLDSVSAEYQKQPIKGYDAMIGNVAHRALTQATRSVGEGETIKLLQNVSTGWANIENSCTIDGDGYTVKTSVGTEGDNQTFVVNKNAADVTIKNMTLVHRRTGNAVRIDRSANVKLENVTIDATQATGAYTEGIITIKTAGTVNLTLDKVNVDMDTNGDAGDKNGAIIRTGVVKASDLKENTVNIIIKDSKLDAAGAKDRHGIVVMEKTNATISVTDSKIKTKNVSAVKANNGAEGTATLPESADLICGKKAEEQEGYKVKLGDTWFIDYNDSLWEVIKNATEDVSITLTNDTTLNLNGLVNKNGKKITINTAGNRLETTGTKDASVTINSEAVVTKGATVVYVNINSVADEVKNATANVTVDVKKDWAVNAAQLANANGKTVTVNSNDHMITVTGTLPAGVTITSKASCATGSTTYYTTFTNALKFAREAEEDAVLKLYDNVSLSSNVVISNMNGMPLTIDGNNKQYTITTKVTNTLCVEHNGTVTLKDLKLKHEAKQGTIMVKETSVLNLQNVDIDAKNIAGYQYGLINLFGKDNVPKNMTLNMTGVTVNMDGTTPSGTDNAIVRTGNGGAAGVKTVTITMNNCNLNTGSAQNLNGIKIKSTTNANITLTNTNITTKNVAPIYNDKVADGYTKDVTVNRIGGTFACADGKVKVGSTFYNTLADAVTAANSATADTTIELCADITDANVWADDTKSELYVTFNNAAGKKLTFDGNWCTMSITHTKSKNALRVSTKTMMKEVFATYSGIQALINVTKATTLELENMVIDANTTTNTGGYLQYAIINASAGSGTTTLTLTNTDITVTSPSYTGGDTCVIRGGNADQSKTVNITLTNTTLDARNSKGRIGIWMPNKAKATVIMNDSQILVDRTTYNKCAAVYGAGSDDSIVRALTLNGTSSVKVITADGELTKQDALYRTTLTDNTVALQTLGLDDEPTTKKLVLEVPVELYDKFIAWIKQFGEAWGWDTGL